MNRLTSYCAVRKLSVSFLSILTYIHDLIRSFDLELRADTLLSTGKLCLAIGNHLVPRMDELLVLVRDSLIQGGSKRSKGGLDVVSEALRCMSDMVKGLGVPFHDRILSLLDPMFQCGLTPELIDTLRVVAEYIPSQKELVQLRLLDESTKILGGDSQVKAADPDYLYSWAKQGQRSGLLLRLRSCGVAENPQNNTNIFNTAAPLRPASPAAKTPQPVSTVS